MKYQLEGLNLDSFYGPNTKQLWLYDNTNDVYIDPPAEVLDQLEKKYGNNIEAAQQELLEIANKKPAWLFETNHWYAEEIDI